MASRRFKASIVHGVKKKTSGPRVPRDTKTNRRRCSLRTLLFIPENRVKRRPRVLLYTGNVVFLDNIQSTKRVVHTGVRYKRVVGVPFRALRNDVFIRTRTNASTRRMTDDPSAIVSRADLSHAYACASVVYSRNECVLLYLLHVPVVTEISSRIMFNLSIIMRGDYGDFKNYKYESTDNLNIFTRARARGRPYQLGNEKLVGMFVRQY